MATPESSADADRETGLRHFVLWALAALKLAVEGPDGARYRLHLPEACRADFAGAAEREFTFTTTARALPDSVERLAVDSPLFRWIVGRLRAQHDLWQAVPRAQPASVHELAPALFKPYTVDRGSVRLAGCTLEYHPLLRYTYRVQAGDSAEMRQVFVTCDEQPPDEALRQTLLADELEPLAGPPARLVPGEIRRWLEAGPRWAPTSAAPGDCELLLVTLVWCKRATGKLLFEIGEAQTEIPFSGWSQLYLAGRYPPPFICPQTGRDSYHLTATDDGRITAAEALGVCQASRRRVLSHELETCSATGRNVLPEFLAACPVTGQRVLRAALQFCSQCRQAVSPTAVKQGRCLACRDLPPITRDDPRMARVLGEYPQLDAWSHWRMSETAEVYILTGASVLWQLLLVLHKETLVVLHMAEGARWLPRWSEIPREQWPKRLT